jgi:hypothetical protein
MSHKAVTQVEIFDMEALKETLAEMGTIFQDSAIWVAYDRKQSTLVDLLVPYQGNESHLGGRMWSGGVGFSRDGNNLTLVMDDLDKARPAVAEFLRGFKQVYALKAAANLLKSLGYSVTKQADGTYKAHSTITSAAKLLQRKSKAAQVAEKAQVVRW